MITIKELRERVKLQKEINKLERFTPLTLFRKTIGWGLIGAGVLTLPIPVTTPIFIGLGCMVLMLDYKKLMKSIKFYSKEFGYFIWRKLKFLIKLIKNGNR